VDSQKWLLVKVSWLRSGWHFMRIAFIQVVLANYASHAPSRRVQVVTREREKNLFTANVSYYSASVPRIRSITAFGSLHQRTTITTSLTGSINTTLPPAPRAAKLRDEARSEISPS
jgi:hypothetical protein